MRDLGTLGGPDAVALLVNERGQVAGDSYISTAQSPTCIFPLATGAFLWEKGKMVDLGSFGGTCTFVFDLNNRGQVVGASRLPGDNVQHPFSLGSGGAQGPRHVWWRLRTQSRSIMQGKLPVGRASRASRPSTHFSGRMVRRLTFGALQGDPCNFGFSINATAQVVGLSVPGCDFNNETAFRAFLWQPGMPMVDLNTLIPPGSALHLSAPGTINDRGEITGFGLLPNGDVHAFLLIPCGEGTEGAGMKPRLQPRRGRVIQP